MRKGYHLTRKEFTEHLRNSIKKAKELSILGNWEKDVDKIYYHCSEFGYKGYTEYIVVLYSGKRIRFFSDNLTKHFCMGYDFLISPNAELLPKEIIPDTIEKLKAFEKECN